ncbi:DUF484 family protein [Marinomonas balearica]|uniref:DUF484 family protein n=1 Tax=Marinomonas balearica TaxID=491947 RepID=A0A4R6M577_9GAMM|nr:DUF484 family protein [Marinomonas balearica]TDO96491.1 hypothetical protein DFP79_3071 [Marinomonas balearica]
MKDEDVVDYLKSTPDFFVRNASLLEALTVPHPVHGGAISLLERQVQLLRKTSEDHRSQFDILVNVARENEATMKKSRRVVVNGLGCETLDDFAAMIDDVIREEFDIPLRSLILFSDTNINSSVRTSTWEDAGELLKEMLSKGGCYCGVLSVKESNFLFPANSDEVMSSAVLPLISRENGQIHYHGVLALGSRRLNDFDKEKGALFLDYLSDLLSAILMRLL